MLDAEKYVAIVNFGDESMALIQWLIEQDLVSKTTLLWVNTGFYAESWQVRIDAASDYALKMGFNCQCLTPPMNLVDMIKSRGSFPSKKFQWCAGLLKGAPINDYLDSVDPFCDVVLLFAKRQENARFSGLLSDRIQNSEHYDGRDVYFPLWQITKEQRDSLIRNTSLPVLQSRSLECHPCIFANSQELKGLSPQELARLSALENELGNTMFNAPIGRLKAKLDAISDDMTPQDTSVFEMGCGSYFGCGE